MKKCIIAVTLSLCLALSGCGSDEVDVTNYSSNVITTAFASDDAFSDRDFESEYDESECVIITLADGASSVSSSGASVDGDIITISEAGSYLVSGTLSDGQIYVEADSDAKVQIILDGVSISNSTTAGIYVYSCDKTFLTLADGSVNTISVEIVNISSDNSDESTVDSAVFARDDLTINGSGTLQIYSESGNGITGKDEVTITSGNFYIVCTKNGIEANDVLAIADGYFDIVTNGGADSYSSDSYDSAFSVTPDFGMSSDMMMGGMSGMTGGMSGMTGGMSRMSDTSDSEDGITLLAGGGMSGGMTSGGSDISLPYSPDSADMGAVSDWFDGTNNTTADTWDMDDSSDYSSKALKCDDVIYIEGGTFNINSYDDAIHSDNNVFITGGSFNIATSDDAIHAEIELVISGGDIYISTCYEGLEAKRVTVGGGDIYINSLDDGINASKSDVTDLGDISITITGGSLVIDSTNEGDGVDSNGSIYMYGGYVLISSTTTTTDTSLDFEDEAIITGGTFLATGSYGMTTENWTEATQGSIFVTLSSVQTGTVTLTDSKGNVIATWEPTKEYQTVHISSSEISDSETYTLVCGSITQTITMSDYIYGTGSHSSSSGSGGMSMSGGMMGR
ncbi:MAG: carbohydrate-binding domain-containing protein [Bacillota bacterium]